MTKVGFIFTVENWKIDKPEEFYNQIWLNGKYIISKYTSKRTLPQNAYYRWLIDIISKEVWDGKDYIHESLRMKFLLDKSKKLPYVKSTTSLNKIEMTEYIENIKNFVATFGLILPSAEDRENTK